VCVDAVGALRGQGHSECDQFLVLQRDLPAFGRKHRGVELAEGFEDVRGLLLVDAGVGTVFGLEVRTRQGSFGLVPR
jgi:hypothetical protein